MVNVPPPPPPKDLLSCTLLIGSPQRLIRRGNDFSESIFLTTATVRSSFGDADPNRKPNDCCTQLRFQGLSAFQEKGKKSRPGNKDPQVTWFPHFSLKSLTIIPLINGENYSNRKRLFKKKVNMEKSPKFDPNYDVKNHFC